MKGGVVLALGVLRELAARPERFAEVALLLVCDEEWRTAPFAHTERFAGWDACLCFEAGQIDARRRATASSCGARRPARCAVTAPRALPRTRARRPTGAATRCSPWPRRRRRVAARHDPAGPDRLTAVPDRAAPRRCVQRRPAPTGELICDLRADDAEAPSSRCSRRSPASVGGVALEAALVRVWPGMDTREATAPVLARGRRARSGRPVAAGARGGASDASHIAQPSR